MKHTQLYIILLLLCLFASSATYAQQVNTLYFLENSPMRHTINPAFQPQSNGFLALSPIGFTSGWIGNNSLTTKDFIYRDASSQSTVTVFHPEYGNISQLKKKIRSSFLTDASMNTNLLNIGIRLQENNYLYVGVNEHVDLGIAIPKGIMNFIFDGGMQDLLGVNSYNWKGLNSQLQVYTDIYGGYSYTINDKVTVGGKLKFLLGSAYANSMSDKIQIEASTNEWRIRSTGNTSIAGPINLNELPDILSYEYIRDMQFSDLFNGRTVTQYLKPSGYGAAIDLGVVYKPAPIVTLTASIVDLGFICWKGKTYQSAIDTTYQGVGKFQYSDYQQGDQFLLDSLKNDALRGLEDALSGFHSNYSGDSFTRMTKMRMNVGAEAKFAGGIVGVGLLSSTQLYCKRLYEEVTFALAVHPNQWAQLALTYSLLNNGNYSNIGAGLSLIPYDGINLTLAMDYIPTSYAKFNGSYCIPYRSKGVNFAMGLSIVWGTAKK